MSAPGARVEAAVITMIRNEVDRDDAICGLHLRLFPRWEDLVAMLCARVDPRSSNSQACLVMASIALAGDVRDAVAAIVRDLLTSGKRCEPVACYSPTGDKTGTAGPA